MKKLVLIDGNALVHRAFHALPPLRSPKGVVINAVFGFSSILIRMIKEIKPDYIAATFDLAGPTFRHEKFEEYKSQRIKAPDELYTQLPIVKDALSAFGIPIYEKEGYEADDLIGTISNQAKKQKGLEIIITTGDLDTLQLIDDEKIRVFTLRKGVTDTVIYDEKAVIKRYGLKPEQLNDFKGLKGDPSDNIPGVPGVGEKTASALIQTFKSLGGLYKQISNFQFPISKEYKKRIKPPLSEKLIEKLLENEDQAFFSKQLSTIVTDLDIDFSLGRADWRKNCSAEKIEKFFKELGFGSLIKRTAEIGILDTKSAYADRDTANKLDKIDRKEIYFTGANAAEVLDDAAQNASKTVVGHDLKALFKTALDQGVEVKNPIFDTKIAAYVLNPDIRNYDFNRIYHAELSEQSAPSALALGKLKQHFESKINSADLSRVFNDIEIPLIHILARMEAIGVKVDTKIIDDLLKLANKKLSGLEEKIYKSAGGEFNINSPRQLEEVLFDKLGVKGKVRKTGGGARSTAAPELEKIRGEHPVVDLILQFRELQKLKSAYIEPFPLLIDKKNGRLHTTYNQAGTSTGRLASQNPNLQNIPVRTELGREFRKAFIAEKGFKLVSFDYSQIELRVVAHLARDKKLISAFRRDMDIHSATAAEIFGVEPDKVTPEQRRQAKVLNFGVLYGMGPVGFMRASGVDHRTASDFIERYFVEFSSVADYIEKTKEKARKNGFVTTLFGRRRPMHDIYATMPQIRAYAERMAVNMPVQGTAADIMKLAMIETDGFARKSVRSADVRLLLQVHDELVFEIKENLVGKISLEIKKIMEKVTELDVPLVIDVKLGQNWQDTEVL